MSALTIAFDTVPCPFCAGEVGIPKTKSSMAIVAHSDPGCSFFQKDDRATFLERVKIAAGNTRDLLCIREGMNRVEVELTFGPFRLSEAASRQRAEVIEIDCFGKLATAVLFSAKRSRVFDTRSLEALLLERRELLRRVMEIDRLLLKPESDPPRVRSF